MGVRSKGFHRHHHLPRRCGRQGCVLLIRRDALTPLFVLGRFCAQKTEMPTDQGAVKIFHLEKLYFRAVAPVFAVAVQSDFRNRRVAKCPGLGRGGRRSPFRSQADSPLFL